MLRILKYLGLALLLALGPLTGCLKLGPDFKAPPSPAPPPAGFQHADTRPMAYVEQDQWWREFNDPELDRLVLFALKRNPDIQKAAAKVLEVQALVTQATSQRYPALNLDAGAKRQQTTLTSEGLPAFLSTDRRTETYNLGLAASFELDLWGRLARAEEAAKADLLQAEENRRTVVQSMVAETIIAYLKQEALERRLAVAQDSLASYRKNLALVDSRYRRGLASVLDVHQARRALAQAQAKIPALELELGQEQQKLALLVGSYPKTRPARAQPEDYFRALKPVPAGLPSELLLRRPDLRAALANLKALNARVGEAMAARFPTLKLTGGFGYTSDALSRLTNPGSELWSLAAGLTQPLFDAGLREALQRAAEARYTQGLADYAKTALKAFSEVEGALLTRQQEVRRRELVQETLFQAKATQEAATSRYQRGLTDYLSVLEAQQTRYAVEDTLVLNELSILTNRVSLHRALGGGWDQIRPALARGDEKL